MRRYTLQANRNTRDSYTNCSRHTSKRDLLVTASLTPWKIKLAFYLTPASAYNSFFILPIPPIFSLFFLSSFLVASFLPCFLPSFLPSFLPFFSPSFLPSVPPCSFPFFPACFLPTFLPSFFHPYLPTFLPSYRPCFLLS